MGVSNDNAEEALRTHPEWVCGLKIFMGSSTGNMLVDNPSTLENIFKHSPLLIATHCEDEALIQANSARYRQEYGENIPIRFHPEIRSVAACYQSSSLAVSLAQRYQTRLHVLHLTTADELSLFSQHQPLTEKRITAEVCVHHLWFEASQYDALGTLIKCNPAIKAAPHREALWEALLDDRLDVIATDHAPHTWAEKQ
ncbi:MAG: dihydroorotase, partial [Microscillaceae bacterium]|nr:dihydroorotase [Microscillaceae bacterium]